MPSRHEDHQETESECELVDGKTIFNFMEGLFWFAVAFAVALLIISIGQDVGAMNGDQAATWRLLSLKVLGGLATLTFCVNTLEFLRLRLVGKEKNDEFIRPGQEVIEVIEGLKKANSSTESKGESRE